MTTQYALAPSQSVYVKKVSLQVATRHASLESQSAHDSTGPDGLRHNTTLQRRNPQMREVVLTGSDAGWPAYVATCTGLRETLRIATRRTRPASQSAYEEEVSYRLRRGTRPLRRNRHAMGTPYADCDAPDDGRGQRKSARDPYRDAASMRRRV